MLMQRIITAVAGLIYIFLMLYIGGWFFKGSVLLMALILMYEFYRGFINKGYKPVKWLGYLFILFIFYSHFISHNYNFILLMTITTLIGLIIPIFDQRVDIMDIMVTIFAGIYPGMMIFFLIDLAFQESPYGMKLLILAFLVTWSTDTFAYLLGSKFGKNKLCPNISPNKTVEGSLGGLIGSVLVGILYGVILNNYFGLEINLYHFAIAGFLGGTLSQLGDLCASSIKRYCGIKDFGKLLPGHGGLLDRFDSLLFTLPALYLYCLLFII